jgi:hypothetical protein
VSSYQFMLNLRQIARAILFVLLWSLFTAAHASLAYGQDFTITPSPLQPAAVDPGGIATSVIALDAVPNSGFDSSVALSCIVTSQVTGTLPLCTISPTSAIPNATPSLTVTTSGDNSPGEYTITITATSGSTTQTATLFLNVIAIPEDYTLTVSKPISPGTVAAGAQAQATITVTPIAGYTGLVTLSCLSVTPVVTAAPYCSFGNPPTPVDVTGGVPATGVLTISTFGSALTTSQLSHPRIFYALWLAVPGLALIAAGATGRRTQKLLGLLLLVAVASCLLFMPACNATTTTGTTTVNGQITPKDTYTFTITGADQNGAGPSNTTTTEATVSLTVN